MSYWKHLCLNMKVVIRCLIMAVFHFLHGILPIKYTSHEFWKI